MLQRWGPRAVVLLWAILLVGLSLRPLVQPTSGTVYVTYVTAGREFAEGRRLYDVEHPFTDNFRYSPLVAAGFVPFSFLPLGVGGMLWRLLGYGLFLTGVNAWWKRVCPQVPRHLLFVAIIPLSLNSLNNGQANTHILGLMLWAAVLAWGRTWPVAGLLVAAGVLFKGYLLAFGGLMTLIAPLRFGLPLLAGCLIGAGLPYLFQSSSYISAQYSYWLENLSRDDRSHFPLWGGLQDVQMLLRIAGFPLPIHQYRWIQLGAGAAAAGLVLWQKIRGVHRETLVQNSLALAVCWMTTFGPAVEAATYILLAPILAREGLDSRGQPRWAKFAAYLSGILFLITIIMLSLPREIHRPFLATGVFPIAALLATAAVLGRILQNSPQPHSTPTEPSTQMN